MAKLNHVQGNYFSLVIPLIKRTRNVIDGKVTDIDTAYTPQPSESVSVRLLRHKGRAFSFIPTVEGSQVTIEDNGKLPLGTYDVEVTITGGDHPMRFCNESTIEVHYATESAGIVPGETLTAITYTLNGAVFFRMGEASGAGPGTASEKWVTDNFQPKGNYISADDMLAVKLGEMMAIEVKTPHDGHAASVPIAWTYDSQYCLFFSDYEGMSYRPLVFTVKRVGAAWQDVEDAVTAAGYEIVRHEIVLLRKQKRKKHLIIEVDKGYEYTRKLKRGYIPYLPAPDQGKSPFEGKDFSQNNSIAMLFTDFLKYDNFHDWIEYNTSNSASFITMKSHDITVDHASYQFVSISFHKNNDVNPYKADFLRFGSYGRNGTSIYDLFTGQIHIDCAIAEMVEVMGHKRFYGNVVYGRLNIAISSTDEYDSFDNRGKTLNMSFIPHRYVENDISPVP